MNITIHRRCRGVDLVEQRIREIGEQAGSLVARRIGGPLPLVEIALTDRKGVVSLVQQADVDLAGGGVSWQRRAFVRVLDHWHVRPLAGTALTSSGALVAIDATRHRDMRELDRTLVHELAHCVQLNLPGARERHIAYLRQQYGITEHSTTDEAAYERLIDVREQQAENLEVLARQLPKGH
ncbi:hypothetical protein ABZ553_14730 [Streptomyces sparsogenes]|uniref:hypothetical protein n=1 Tax=Streptomyces sparsogenes TaxID=67365 RepID=UPI0033CD7A37